MAEYIPKEVAIENAIDQMRHSNSEKAMRERILNLEATDVRPVVRGHKVTYNRPIAGYWVSGKLDGGWDGMEGRVWVKPIMDNPVDYCSECGKRLDDTFQNFCPNCGADLRGADLRGADLKWADLQVADLQGAKNIPYIHITCPDAGAFIAWKKVNGYIVKLQIPEDAKRCSATSRKCRCDKALVLAIENPDGTDAGITTLTNTNFVETVYTVGEMVFPDSWDENRWNECSHGIHFFVNRKEAVNW